MDIAKCLKQNRRRYGRFIEEYLFSRDNIELIILILDIRHEPTENDIIMYDYIKSTSKPYLIVANKADKIAVTKVQERICKLREELGLREDETIVPFSAERKIYIDNMWDKINL